MNDNILHSVLLAAALSAVLFSSVSALLPATQATSIQAARVVQIEKTVVTARRMPADLALADTGGR